MDEAWRIKMSIRVDRDFKRKWKDYIEKSGIQANDVIMDLIEKYMRDNPLEEVDEKLEDEELDGLKIKTIL